MHFRSKAIGGFTVYAVSGTNTVSFAIDFSAGEIGGLLGFAVERLDPVENERYFMQGMKVFRSVVPAPDENAAFTTFDHPVQSFVWDDFTAKPGRPYTYFFYPLRGKPKNLDRSAPPVQITVETEKLFSSGTHDVFFNRGIASSQAYARRFQNQRPDEIDDSVRKAAALQWLSRELDEALLAFIDNAQPGDTLLGCFYEFRYMPAAMRLKNAVDRGVAVRLIVDGKVNEFTDKNGNFHESFPREENKRIIAAAGLPDAAIALMRENNPDDIQHNKFMVLLKGAGRLPDEVWTGSTNLSMGGIHGQTNVGHWVRDKTTAERFRDYWESLVSDPGARPGTARAQANADRKRQREAVMLLATVPAAWAEIPPGITTVFSPRLGTDVLDMYAAMLDEAQDVSCITLAFGINKTFKARLADNDRRSHVTFLLLEKEDKANPRSHEPFVPLHAAHNVYQAWGASLHDPLHRWTRETSARALGLNTHVSYIHSKFLLQDPLGPDPIVVTGSANFSAASTTGNDENMLVIRGDGRVADIYFTEFNRLFYHYYFRSIQAEHPAAGPSAGASAGDGAGSRFMEETDAWLEKYKPGRLRRKRVEMFKRMANARLI